MSDYHEHQIIELLNDLNRKLDRIIIFNHRFSNMEHMIMVSLADIQSKAAATLAQVQADTSVVNSVKTVVDNQNTNLAALKAQIDALIAAGTADPAALQALADTIDAIQSTDMANSQVVAAAVAAGTPAAPPTP